jgi:hypothetical protein
MSHFILSLQLSNLVFRGGRKQEIQIPKQGLQSANKDQLFQPFHNHSFLLHKCHSTIELQLSREKLPQKKRENHGILL